MSYWSGYKFVNVPKDDQHRYYRALRDAKIPSYEFPEADLVIAMTAGAEADTPGDIVPIVEILHRSIPYLLASVTSKCRFLGVRLKDEQVEEIENAVASERQVDLDQIHQGVREPEGPERILRPRE